MGDAEVEMERHELIERIYEAAALPELWPSVLGAIERVGEGDGTLLFTTEGGSFRFVASERGAPIAQRYLEQGWASRTDRVQRLFALRRAGFVTDLDIYDGNELEHEPVYRDFLRLNGLGWGAATAVLVPDGERMVLSVERAHARGPVPRNAVRRLDVLRPHLARSVLLSARLRMKAARTAMDMLDLVGIPAGIIDGRGRSLVVNARFEAFTHRVVKSARRLSLLDAQADTLLQAALERLHQDKEASVRSIPIPANADAAPMVLHLLAVRRSAADILGSAAAIVVVTVLAPGAVPSGTILEALFDLTPAEARVAGEIVMGRTLAEIALANGISYHTARAQLKAVLAKTGVRRQAELVGLLSQTSLDTP